MLQKRWDYKMAKKTVQDLIIEKLTILEKKIDDISSTALPKVVTDVAVMKTEAIIEARTTSRIHGTVWGVITLGVSIAGLAIAYFRH
jgi:hypothetical protein